MIGQAFDATIKFGLLTVILMAAYAWRYGGRASLALVIALAFLCYLTQVINTAYAVTPGNPTWLLSLSKAMWLATLAFGVYAACYLWQVGA